jgi:hypothetical protein
MNKIKFLFLALAAVALLPSCEDLFGGDDDSNEVVITNNIETATTWKADKIYVIDGDIDVDANLTIEPGTVIKFKTGSSLGFGYSQNTTVTANGTAEKRIVFTSYNANPAPGAWDGLAFYQHTLQNTSLTYCDIEWAGKDDWAAIDIRCRLTFNNNRVRSCKTSGMELNGDSSFMSFTGNTIESCPNHAIILYPAAVHTLGVNNQITCNNGYGILVNDGSVTSTTGTNLTWKKQQVPYIMDGTITIETNLTIEAGTTLAFNAGARMDFGYSATTTLTAVGTANEKITFTSSSTSPAAGAWRGIYLYQPTPNTRFEQCKFEYAGYDQEACLYVRNVAGLTVKNCHFRQSNGRGIHLVNSTLSAGSEGNTFENCALGNIVTENE